MSAEENKILLRKYIQAVWEHRNPEAVEQFLSPHYKRHRTPTSAALTRDGQKQLIAQFQAAFPDLQISVEDIVAEADHLAFRSTMHGTHQGEILGIAPTGNQIHVGLVDIIYIRGGQFLEQWGGPDLLDLAHQLGAQLSVG